MCKRHICNAVVMFAGVLPGRCEGCADPEAERLHTEGVGRSRLSAYQGRSSYQCTFAVLTRLSNSLSHTHIVEYTRIVNYR